MLPGPRVCSWAAAAASDHGYGYRFGGEVLWWRPWQVWGLGSGQEGFAASLCFQKVIGVTTYNAFQAIDTSCHLCCDF